MYNKDLINILMEHGQYAELAFTVDGKRVCLHDLEGRIENDGENITLNFRRCADGS